MKIAVTYENGEVFQHFGKTQAFKVYEVEGGKILSAEVIGTDGTGHEALAGYLAGKGVTAVICGGLGDGAQAALAEAGIVVISGASGNADEALEAFLRGELESKGVNCDHHDHEDDEESCGGCEGDCGGGCGGCGGGCGGCGGYPTEPIYEGPNAGKTVRVHYSGTFNDGTEFDSSYRRNEPMEFVCGMGMMIPGFDKAVVNMKVGETVNIHLTPDEAYGEADPGNIFTVNISDLTGSEGLEVGQRVYLYDRAGRPILVRVSARDALTITFDANSEMAGKELNFKIELLEVL